MKKFLPFLMILMVLLVFFVCDSGNGGGNSNPFIGTWKGEDNEG